MTKSLGWLISDCLKIVTVAVLWAFSCMHSQQSGIMGSKRRLQYLNLIIGLVLLTWLLLTIRGMTWQSFLVLSNVVIMLQTYHGLYICYTITSTSYATWKLSSKLPRRIVFAFPLCGVLLTLCHVVGVMGVLITRKYWGALFTHVATAATIIIVTTVTSSMLLNLRGLLRKFNPSLEQPLAREEKYVATSREQSIGPNAPGNELQQPANIRNHFLALDATLKRTLIVLLVVCGIGSIACSLLVVSAYEDNGKSDYNYESSSHYDAAADVVDYWSVVAMYFWNVYYPSVKIKKCCCFDEPGEPIELDEPPSQAVNLRDAAAVSKQEESSISSLQYDEDCYPAFQ